MWPTVQWAKILLFTSTRGSAKGCKGASLGKILENLVAVGRVGRDEQFRAAPSIFSALLLPPPGVPCSPSNIIKHLLVAAGYPLVSTLLGRKCARIPPDTTGYHPDTTPNTTGYHLGWRGLTPNFAYAICRPVAHCQVHLGQLQYQRMGVSHRDRPVLLVAASLPATPRGPAGGGHGQEQVALQEVADG